ncbi:hypothetical protein [Quadrisphaera sp. DSM 44207]|uniref:hypothetical protein n=1 Tax=Quadrisphaera sp. DSM 44207 TaxID=1881057 RepID=UPI0008851CF2|nr:hypothetical protein [Quadrisphaera sp. DSM 44207]SDQ63423.1 hypothetical protein SAMN05428996_2173 [Quadrisphaera sp. DSM 44207]
MFSHRRTRCTVLAVATAVLVLPGCGGGVVDDPPTVPEQGDLQDQQLEDQVEETDDDQPGLGEDQESGLSQEVLEGRVGDQVDFDGEVSQVLSPRAFLIGGIEVGEDPLLVLGADVPTALAIGDVVQVSGTVVDFSIAGAEEDLEVNFAEEALEDFEGDPAVQATSVAVR